MKDNYSKAEENQTKAEDDCAQYRANSSAYQIAWKHISAPQKHEQPNISLRIHASIRRQLKEGAKDPNVIVAEALSDLQTYTGVTYKRPGNGKIHSPTKLRTISSAPRNGSG
jgi:hypothetical protein